jgi:hypothetical protein
MPRGPRHHDGPTERQVLRQIYEALWVGNRKRRTDTARVIKQARKAGFTITTPAPVSERRLHSAIPHLKEAAAATHDPRYLEMIEALERDGIDNPRNLSRAGENEFLDKVARLRRDGMSVLEACERVVAEWGLGTLTTTFEVEVERLRKSYHLRSGRPA